MLYRRNTLQHRLRAKEWAKDIQTNEPQKKAGIAIFISSTQDSGTPTEDEAERLQL